MLNLFANLNYKNIAKISLVIFIIELFSLLSFKSALLSAIFFILLLGVTLLFTLYKLEYGLLIALTELMIGSQGYLFYLALPNFKFSLRLGIFLIIFFVWFFKEFRFKKYLQILKTSRLIQNFALLLIVLAWGVAKGIQNGYSLSSVFFDVNGFLYFGLFFVFINVFNNLKAISNWLHIYLASLFYVCLKIFFTLYLFSHGIPYLTEYFYTWIRDTRVGEITYAGANFFRIFFQSQIYSLIAIFIITCLIIFNYLQQEQKLQQFLKSKNFQFLCGLLIFVQTSILISFSRSFWLGGIVGFISLYFYLIFVAKIKFKKILAIIGLSLSAGILSILLLLMIANFPFPKPSALFSADMLKDRLSMISGEAGVSSRWNLLPVLINKVKEAPLLGSGFGTTVTYKTEDPRIKKINPDGWYTTYTFEWGYLDTATEIGILGSLVYLAFIGQILYLGWQNLKNKASSFLNAGFLLGLLVLLATHAFSPYLNHPLGISYLLLSAAIFQGLKPLGVDKQP